MPKRFEYLEHTADLRFRSYGATIGECFSNSARAMFNAIIDPSTVRDTAVEAVRLEAGTLEMLLHDWLSEILYLFETSDHVYSDFESKVTGIEGAYVLEGKLIGEPFDLNRHGILASVKAVTYHGILVEERDGTWVAEVLCDV